MKQPFLLLTMRRTGGTSLMDILAQSIGFHRMEDEPFNPDRIWGDICRLVLRPNSKDAVRQRLRDALSVKPVFKHCIDVAPINLTHDLVAVCNELGYKFIYLDRRREDKRLASLFLAQATGVWGSSKAAEVYPSIIAGLVRPAEIKLSDVRVQIKRDRDRVAQFSEMMQLRGTDYFHLHYEDVFQDQESLMRTIKNISRYLLLSDNELNLPPSLSRWRFGLQESAVIGPYIEGYDTMLEILRSVESNDTIA